MDPFSLDIWDSFKDFPFPSSSLSSFPIDNLAFISTKIDQKETLEVHVFKANVLGVEKERRSKGVEARIKTRNKIFQD